jgi:hypothetical protein
MSRVHKYIASESPTGEHAELFIRTYCNTQLWVHKGFRLFNVDSSYLVESINLYEMNFPTWKRRINNPIFY